MAETTPGKERLNPKVGSHMTEDPMDVEVCNTWLMNIVLTQCSPSTRLGLEATGFVCISRVVTWTDLIGRFCQGRLSAVIRAIWIDMPNGRAKWSVNYVLDALSNLIDKLRLQDGRLVLAASNPRRWQRNHSLSYFGTGAWGISGCDLSTSSDHCIAHVAMTSNVNVSRCTIVICFSPWDLISPTKLALGMMG